MLKTITDWKPEEVVKFIDCADFDPHGRMKDPDQCMLFRTTEFSNKHPFPVDGEKTPMYHVKGHLVSAQRISIILFLGIDPIEKAKIITLCPNDSCINPYHLEIMKEPEEKKKKKNEEGEMIIQ